MLHPAAAWWEATGNRSTEPNANWDHADAAGEKKRSLCTAAVPGDKDIWKGHLAPCQSQCRIACKCMCWGKSCWQHPKSNFTTLFQLTSCTGMGHIQVFPSTLGRCQPAQAQQHPSQGAEGYRCPRGQVGAPTTVMGAVHPRVSFRP